MALNIQFELFIYALFIGIYLGVTYDLLYYFILMHLNKIVKTICDIIFFICQGFIIFNIIYKINNGIIPVYCYFLFFLGFLIYYQYSQLYYQKNILPLKKLVNKSMTRVIKILHYFFVKPLEDTYLFFLKIGIYLYQLIKKLIVNIIKKIKKRKSKRLLLKKGSLSLKR